MPSPAEEFQALLQMGIDERNRALNPSNVICAIPLSRDGRKIVERELKLLTHLSMEFDALFEVE
jgi:hypothetical protein